MSHEEQVEIIATTRAVEFDTMGQIMLPGGISMNLGEILSWIQTFLKILSHDRG